MADQEEQNLLEQARKLPMSERVESKNWKIRKEAYDSIKEILEQSDSQNEEFKSNGQYLDKAISDTNAACMGAGLDALEVYVNKIDEETASSKDRTIKLLVTKVLPASKPGTVEKGKDVLLLMIEQGQGNSVLEYIEQGLKHKVPKVVLACVDTLLRAVSQFGSAAFQPKPLLAAIPPLFDSKDVKTRETAKKLAAQAGIWFGWPVVEQFLLANVRDATKTDIENEYSKLQEAGPPTASRFTRAAARQAEQQPVAPNQASDTGEAKEAAQPAAPAVAVGGIDMYDLATPFDLAKVIEKDKALWEGLASQKWKDRKEAIQKVRSLTTANPRLQAGDYGDFTREIKKIIVKDSNQAVVCEALAMLAALANGLRKDFSQQAKQFTKDVLEKFKEKSTLMCKGCNDALTAIHTHCLHLDDLQEQLVTALQHKHPKVRVQTLEWLPSAIQREQPAKLAASNAMLVPACVANVKEADVSVRTAAIETLAAYVKKVGGMKTMEKYFKDLDESRKQKIQDAVNGQSAAAPSQRPAQRPTTAGVSRQGSRVGASSKSAASGAVRRSASTVQDGPKKSAPTKAGGTAADEETLTTSILTKDQAAEKLVDLLGDELSTQLKSAAWKERLEAATAIQAQITANNPTLIQSAGPLMHALSCFSLPPEKIQAVSTALISLLDATANAATTLTKLDTYATIGALHEKLAEIRASKATTAVLLRLSEFTGPKFVITQLNNKIKAHKNPKVTAAGVTWVSAALSEFGVAPCDRRVLEKLCREYLPSTQYAVREAAVQLTGNLHRFVGPELLGSLTADLPKQVSKSVSDECEKWPLQATYTPTRFVIGQARTSGVVNKTGAMDIDQGGQGGAAAADEESEDDMDDDCEAVDIMTRVEPYLDDMGSKDWKARRTSLTEVQSSIPPNRLIVNNIDPLVSALKPRLADSNKLLAQLALDICAKLATGLGGTVDKGCKALVSPAMKNLWDSKAGCRTNALKFLDAYIAKGSLGFAFKELATALSSPKCLPDASKEALVWLKEKVPAKKRLMKGEGLEGVVKVAGVGLMDKSGEVKECAHGLVGTVVGLGGVESVKSVVACVDDSGMRQCLSDAVNKAGGKGGDAMDIEIPTTQQSQQTATGSQPRSTLQRKASGIGGSSGIKRQASGLKGDGDKAADEGIVFQMSDKEGRGRKNRFKTTKFDGFRNDELETLSDELRAVVSPQVHTIMFGKDFLKHNMLFERIPDTLPASLPSIISNLDLLLKWTLVRIYDDKNSSQARALEFMSTLADALAAQNYALGEYEASCFIPALIDKVGLNNERMRAAARDVLAKYGALLSPVRLLQWLADGLDSKNTRTRVECLQLIQSVLSDKGGEVLSHPRLQNLVAKTASQVAPNGDPAIRSAALCAIEVMYLKLGQVAFWRGLQRLQPQSKGLIEERVKHIDKQQEKIAVQQAAIEQEQEEAAVVAERVAQQVHLRAGERGGSVHRGEVENGGGGGMRGGEGTENGKVEEEGGAARELGKSKSKRQMTAEEAINMWSQCMQKLTEKDLDVVIHGMKGMCMELLNVGHARNDQVRQFVCNTVSELIYNLSDIMVRVFPVFIAVVEQGDNAQGEIYGRAVSQNTLARACKYVINTILQVYNVPGLRNRVDLQIHQKALVAAMCLLAHGNDKFSTLPEGGQLYRAMSVVTIRILDVLDVAAAQEMLLQKEFEVELVQTSKDLNIAYDMVSDQLHRCMLRNVRRLSDIGINETIVASILTSMDGYFRRFNEEELRSLQSNKDACFRILRSTMQQMCAIDAHMVVRVAQNLEWPTAQPMVFVVLDSTIQRLAGCKKIPEPIPPPLCTGQGRRQASIGGNGHTADPAQYQVKQQLRDNLKELCDKITQDIHDDSQTGLYIQLRQLLEQHNLWKDLEHYISHLSQTFQDTIYTRLESVNGDSMEIDGY